MKQFLFFITSLVLAINLSAQTAVVKKVLLEEFTTASCGNCPMGSYKINTWVAAHSESVIVLDIHEGSGVDANTGVFVYRLDAVFSSGERIERKGNISPIR